MSTGRPHSKRVLQTVVQAQHFLWRTVCGKDDLSACLIERVEGMKHLLLAALLAGNKLNVIHQEDIGKAVFLPKLLIAPLTNRLDEFVGKGVAFDIEDPIIRVVMVDAVGNGIEQMCFSQSGLSIDEERIIALGWIFSDTDGRQHAANLLEEPTTKRSKVYSSVPGRKLVVFRSFE